MKILKLAPYYAPERISSSHLTADMEDAYVEAGIISEIYAPTPTRGITKEERKFYKKNKYEEKRDGMIRVHRFNMFREGKNPIGRALRYILVNLIQYHKGIHAKEVDAVVASSTPPTQGLLCAMVTNRLSKKYGRLVPFIFNLQDIFPESLVTAGLCKRSSFLYKIGNFLSDYTYQKATHIRVISDSMKDILIHKGIPAEKITVIYNWIDTEATIPVAREDNPLFDELNLDRNKFYVTYAGNLGNSQNANLLLSCAKVLKDNETIRFVIFGGGTKKEEFEKEIANSGLSNIQLFPLQPMERVSQVYSLGDASFITCKKGAGVGAFPSKAASIMAAGTAVIASFDLDSDLCRILNENKAGLCTEAEDVDGAVSAILSLYNNRNLCRLYGNNARYLACTRFSKEVGTAANIALLKK